MAEVTGSEILAKCLKKEVTKDLFFIMGGPMMGYPGPEAMLDRIDGRLAFLKTELKITEEQTPVWEELAGAIRASAPRIRTSVWSSR